MRWLQQEGTMQAEKAPSHPRFGWPSPCPNCGAIGHLDYIDLVARDMRQTCPECGVEWVRTEDSCDPPGPIEWLEEHQHH